MSNLRIYRDFSSSQKDKILHFYPSALFFISSIIFEDGGVNDKDEDDHMNIDDETESDEKKQSVAKKEDEEDKFNIFNNPDIFVENHTMGTNDETNTSVKSPTTTTTLTTSSKLEEDESSDFLKGHEDVGEILEEKENEQEEDQYVRIESAGEYFFA